MATTTRRRRRSFAASWSEWERRKQMLRRTLLRPPPRLTLSEWSDRNRVLSPEASAEPGPWRTDRAPYLRGIMDAVSDLLVRRVAVMASSQVGKTEVILNATGYFIDQDPAPMLVVQANERPMGEAFSKDRLRPMIRDTACLREKVQDSRKKSGTSTLLHKVFPGGHLTIIGANSPAGLGSRPIRIVLADEVDRYPESAGKEGDPLWLVIQRTRTFWNRKIVMISTPTDKDSSRIEAEWKKSDQRRFFVPCPHCDHIQHLVWGQVEWETEVRCAQCHAPTPDEGECPECESSERENRHRPETAAYVCEECGTLIDESDKRGMLARGEWRATNPDGAFPGFHINALYSPWVTWAELAAEFLEAKDDPDKLKAFVNLQFGEPWEDRNEDVDPEQLHTRAEDWEGEVPMEAGVLTAAVDVHDDRLEFALWAWGDREEAWLVTHQRFWGDTQQGDVWAQLEALLTRRYEHAGGAELPIMATCIDAGHRTDQVYDFVRPRERRRVYAIMGQDSRAKHLLQRQTRKNRHGVKLWTVMTPPYKDILFRRLKIQRPGPGYIHFCPPTSTGADREFFAQFGGEVVEKRRVPGGRYVRRYKQIRANEAIDLYVYGLAALHTLSPAVFDNLGKYAEKARKAGESEGEEGADDAADRDAGRRRRGRGSNWTNKWRD